MAKFEVSIKEVHDVTVVIDTDKCDLPANPTRLQLAAQAEQIHLDSSDLDMEYSHTLDVSSWTMRNMETGNYIPY